MATIKITGLTSIGANLTSSTVIPVVNMSGTPTTEKTLLGNIANVVLAGAGGNYTAAAVSILAQSVPTTRRITLHYSPQRGELLCIIAHNEENYSAL